jgi:alkyldihydroxyacetonephosphate synthase
MKRSELAQYVSWLPTTPSLSPRLLRHLTRRFPDARPFPVPEGILVDDTTTLEIPWLDALAKDNPGLFVRRRLSDRIRVASGLSSEDLVQARLGQAPSIPIAVVEPTNHDDVSALLCAANAMRVSVVPRGGGTSVTGAVCAPEGAIVIDLAARMNTILSSRHSDLSIDGVLTAQAGILGPALEAAARKVGRTVGHFPQSFERSTLGGWIAARSAGQLSSRHGRADQMLVGIRAATVHGEIVVRPGPARAVGPDVLQLLAGSEGALAVITEASVRTMPAHEAMYFSAWLLPSFESGVDVVRKLSADGVAPAALRLSDENETIRLFVAASGDSLAGKGLAWLSRRRPQALMLIITDGPADEIRLVRRRVREHAFGAGAVPLGSSPARSWWNTRFTQPGLRDALLDLGIVTETMETAVSFSQVQTVVQSVRQALTEMGADVGVHVSHVYRDGCSLYFTFLFAPKAGEEIHVLQMMRDRVARLFLKHGCPLSHHHGVGRTWQHLVEEQCGATAMSALRAAKHALDPNGIMNPGTALDFVGPETAARETPVS